jgi:hypothetical protein
MSDRDSSISSRTTFLGIDQATRALLRETKPTIMQELPPVLDGFYRHIGGYPEVRRFFSDEAHMRHAKEMQIKHWPVDLQCQHRRLRIGRPGAAPRA